MDETYRDSLAPRDRAASVVLDTFTGHPVGATWLSISEAAVDALLEEPHLLADLAAQARTGPPSDDDLTALLERLVPPATMRQVRQVVRRLLVEATVPRPAEAGEAEIVAALIGEQTRG